MWALIEVHVGTHKGTCVHIVFSHSGQFKDYVLFLFSFNHFCKVSLSILKSALNKMYYFLSMTAKCIIIITIIKINATYFTHIHMHAHYIDKHIYMHTLRFFFECARNQPASGNIC